MEREKKVLLCAVTAAVKQVLQIVESDEESSDDEWFEDFVVLNEFQILRKLSPRKRKIPRIENYFEITIPRYSPKEFQSHFRITCPAFNELCRVLEPILMEHYITGRPLKQIRKQILSVVWLLATPDSYRSVGDRFNSGKSVLSDAFMRIVKALVEIAPRIIKWPTVNEAAPIQEQLTAIAGLNGVVGAVDGTYVPIKAPKHNAEVYITCKSQYAMTLQGIAVPSLKFIDCFIGYPGSVSDARIFRNSHIYQAIEADYEQYFANSNFIIGDKAYPVLRWCIPPYIVRRELTLVERNFNNIHAKTRQVVERTFALLFGRFRRLKYLDMNRTDMIPATVIACCVLHKIALNYNDLLVEDYIAEGAQYIQHEEHNHDVLHGIFPGPSHARRDEIARTLFNNRRR